MHYETIKSGVLIRINYMLYIRVIVKLLLQAERRKAHPGVLN